MSYTVWMDGIKIGETAFDVRHGTDRRAGIFHPTELGLSMLPGITTMGPALLDVGRMCRERGVDIDDPALDTDSSTEEVFQTPEGHRVLEAARQIARLELHDPSGEIVAWESILITDLHDLTAAAGARSLADDAAAIDHRGRAPVRYFITAKIPAARRSMFPRLWGRSVS